MYSTARGYPPVEICKLQYIGTDSKFLPLLAHNLWTKCLGVVYYGGMKGKKVSDTKFLSLLEGLRSGLSRNEAAMRAGLSLSAVGNWFTRQGENPRAKELCRDIEQAEAEGELELLQVVRKSPHSAMTLLARKYPNRYGRQRDEPGLIGGAGNITIKQLNVMITEARKHGDPASLITATGIGDDLDAGSVDSGIGSELADKLIEEIGTGDGI